MYVSVKIFWQIIRLYANEKYYYGFKVKDFLLGNQMDYCLESVKIINIGTQNEASIRGSNLNFWSLIYTKRAVFIF